MRKEKKSPDMYKHSYSPAASAIFLSALAAVLASHCPPPSPRISSSMTPLTLGPRLTFLHLRCPVTPENLGTFYQFNGAAKWGST